MSYDFSMMAFVTDNKVLFRDSYIFTNLGDIKKEGSGKFIVAFEND